MEIKSSKFEALRFREIWTIFDEKNVFVHFFKKFAQVGYQTQDLLIVFIFKFPHFTFELQQLPLFQSLKVCKFWVKLGF